MAAISQHPDVQLSKERCLNRTYMFHREQRKLIFYLYRVLVIFGTIEQSQFA